MCGTVGSRGTVYLPQPAGNSRSVPAHFARVPSSADRPMRINFLLPGYAWRPSGGFRVVYQHANRLAARGHLVTVIHPRRLEFAPPPEIRFLQSVRRKKLALMAVFSRPSIAWQPI